MWCLHLLTSVEAIIVSRIIVFIFFLHLNLPMYRGLISLSCLFSLTYLYVSNYFLHLLSLAEVILVSRIEVLLFYHLLNSPFCLELMSSYSVFNWICLSISNCCLCLLSAFENTIVSRISVFFFLVRLNLPLHLELMSSYYFSFEISFVFRTDSFSPQLSLYLYLELMSSYSVFSWTSPCISNWCLHHLSSFEFISASRINLFIFLPLLICSFYLDLLSLSSFSS